MPESLYRVFLGPAVLAALFCVGGYFCVRLHLFWVIHPRRSLAAMRGTRSPREVFRAVCLALGGTMGVGNIAGVALALLTGGAGAVFWMLLAAFFSMAVKYAEVVLAMDTRVETPDGSFRGGAPYYMKRPGGRPGFLSVLFSLLCVVCAVFQGSLLQGNAVGESFSVSYGVPPGVTGAALSIVALLILLFAASWIPRLTSVLIPISTVLYLTLTLSVLFLHRGALGEAWLRIFREAFSARAGVGGILGFLFSDAARIGCARGLLSNEAGCGTAPLAHITSHGTTPAGQGLFGIFEVFLDTVVVCTLTALACLTSGVEGSPDAPLAYVTDAFSTLFGDAAAALTAPAVFGFAFATTLSWAFYGLSCLTALSDSPTLRVGYLVLYAASLAIGAVSTPGTVYSLIDLLLGVMTLTNLFVLVRGSDRVVALSRESGLISCRRLGDVPARARRAR